MSNRSHTNRINLGSVAVGGDAPISVQTMTKTDTRDIDSTVSQIRTLEMIGCDIVRIAVIDEKAARALAEIKKAVSIPIIADIHFNHQLALISLESGVDGLRINPGNIGSKLKVKEVVDAARDKGGVPIRIGVNGGSLEKSLLEKYGKSCPEALVESALSHVAILEDLSYHEIKISVKTSDVMQTVEAYRILSERTDYPLHLGVTEAGTFMPGTVRSSVALGILLAEGIGDTIRVSLTDLPEKEVRVGQEILRSLGLRAPGACVVACPTCGRTQVNVVSMAQAVESELEEYYRENPAVPRPSVAVMGCIVNGPGEAAGVDLALAGGKGKFALYVKGAYSLTINESDAVDALMNEVREWRKE